MDTTTSADGTRSLTSRPARLPDRLRGRRLQRPAYAGAAGRRAGGRRTPSSATTGAPAVTAATPFLCRRARDRGPRRRPVGRRRLCGRVRLLVRGEPGPACRLPRRRRLRVGHVRGPLRHRRADRRPADLPSRLAALVAAGRPADAVTTFQPRASACRPRWSPGSGSRRSCPRSRPSRTRVYDATVTGRPYDRPTPETRAVDVPVLALTGAETWPILRRAAEALPSLLPNARYVAVPGGEDHTVPPAETAAVVREFLAGHWVLLSGCDTQNSLPSGSDGRTRPALADVAPGRPGCDQALDLGLPIAVGRQDLRARATSPPSAADSPATCWSGRRASGSDRPPHVVPFDSYGIMGTTLNTGIRPGSELTWPRCMAYLYRQTHWTSTSSVRGGVAAPTPRGSRQSRCRRSTSHDYVVACCGDPRAGRPR